MARGRKVLACAAALAVLAKLRPAFVPSPLRKGASVALPAAAAIASAPAWADPIGDAAKKLSDASYPFLKEVDWNSYKFLLKPGSAPAGEWAKAVDKMISMGAAMDSKALKDGVMAHHKAIGSVTEANPTISKADYEAINAAIGRMIASVPESQTMDVYNTISGLVSSEVPPFLMSGVKEEDAKRAYSAFLEFKDVVKANPITASTPSTPAGLSAKLPAVEAAAQKLSAASYPFIKDVDWTSSIYNTPLPGVTPVQMLKAIDKALVMGASMDGKLLKEAAEAHHKALNSMDAKLVTTEADYTAVNVALGKLIASVPTSKVLDVFNAFKAVTPGTVPNNMLREFNFADAQAAFTSFWQFKDIVKAAQ